jgi:fibronectin-binding autotransporter adhesin
MLPTSILVSTFAVLPRRAISAVTWLALIGTIAFGPFHLPGGPALAWSATLTWNKTATGTNWSTASNWGGTLPGSGDIGLFSAISYTSQPSLSSTAAIGGIWDTGAGVVTIGGSSALTLFGATINSNTGTGIEMDASAGPLTVNAPLVLQNNQQWINFSGSALTVNGAISGSGALTKTGGGIVALGGSNSFSGGMTISQGTLQLANSAALLNSTVAINANNALQFSPGIGTYYLGGLSGGNLLKLADTASGVVGLIVGGNGASTTFSGAISGSGSLTKTGGGNLVLSGSDTYTGLTTLAAGQLLLDFTQPGAPSANIVNNASNASALALAGGTLAIQGSPTLSNSQRFNGVTVNPGGSAVVLTASNPLLLSVGNINRSAAGGTIDFTLPGGTQSAANGITTTTPNNATGILGAFATVAGADWACSTAGNITAYTAYTAGDLGQMASNAALNVSPSGGQTAVASATVFNTLNLTSTEGVTMTGTGSLTLVGGGLLANTSGVISGGTLEGSSGTAGNAELIVITPQNFTIASIIADNGGATSLTKSGPATLTLTVAEGYTGTTLVAAGTLLLANSAVLSASTFDSSGGGALSFGTLNSAAFSGLQGSGNLTLNNASPAAVTLSVGGNNASTTFSGGLSGSGSLTKIGSGLLTLTGPNTFSGTTTVDGGTLQLSSGGLASPTQYVGYSATGSFVQWGGVNAPSVNLYLGYNPASIGTYSLSGGSLSAVVESAGYSGSGSFTQSGGTNAAGTLVLGQSAGSTGTYNLTGGGLFCANGGYIGYSGSGSFTQSGGTNSLPGSGFNILYLGYNAGSNGTYSLSGSGLLSWPYEYIGGNYLGAGGAVSGSFSQSGGTNSVADYLRLGLIPGSSGSYSLTGGLLNSSFEEWVGYMGNGSFMQSGGTNFMQSALDVGSNGGSRGTYNLSGSALLLASSDEYIGDTGSGSLTQLGGSNSTNDLYLGYQPHSSGTYSLSGGSLSALQEVVGSSGSGSFTQSSGTNNAGDYLFIGEFTGSSGTYSLSGGSLSGAAGSTAYVGYSGTGSFIQSGGTQAINNLYLGFNTGSSGSYSLSGGSLFAYNETVGPGSFVQSGGTNTLSPTVSGQLLVGHFSNGTYSLTGSGLLSAQYEYIGYAGNGSFTHMGGTNVVLNELDLGDDSGSGSYNLSGSGMLTAPIEYVGASGTGNFVQFGGTNAVSANLTLGYLAGSSGTYSMSGGLLTAPYEVIGAAGSGSFAQSGGTNSTGSLVLGQSAGSTGTYNLSGSGLLFAPFEYIGTVSALSASGASGGFTQSGGTNSLTNLYVGFVGSAGTYSLSGSGLLSAVSEQILGPTSLFQQTGGSNSASVVILSGGRYLLTGGLLEINGGLETAGGTLNFSGGSGTIQATNSIVDLAGSIGNTSSSSLEVGPNSLVIVPAASSSSAFAVFNNAGLTHVLGTTLNVSAGTGFGGLGTITDPVNCQGTIIANAGYGINLTNGLTLSGTGRVNLRSGVLTINDMVSNVSGASALTAAALIVASSGAGSFSQSGGSITLSDLYLGYSAAGSGAYSLSGSGRLSAPYEYTGYYGAGSFTQSGGTNSVSGQLVLAEFAGSSGTYNLNGGLLTLSYGGLTQGAGSASFNFGGGTLGATIPWTSAMNLNVTASGAATVDTTGGNIALAGNLTGSGTLNKAGAGTLTLSGTNSALGALNVSFGTLQIVAGSLTATSEYAGYSGIGVIKQTGGTNAVSNAVYLGPHGAYDLSGGLLLTPSIQGSAGTLSVSGGTLSAQTVGVSTAVRRHLTIQANAISGAITGNGSVTMSGSGTTFLTGSNPFSGEWTVSLGSLELGNANALQYATLDVNVNGGLLFFPNIGTFNVGGLAGSGSFTLDDAAQNATTLVLGGNNADTTYSGAIGGLGGVIKEGGGKITLLGKNTFKGGFGIDPGIVSINADAALGDPTGSTTWSGLTANVIFQANSTLQADASFALSASRTIAISAGATATVDNQGYTFTIGSPISGPGAVATAGSGTLVLCGSNTYTGATTVAIGMLKLDFSQSGAPPANIINNQTDSSSLALGGGTLAILGNANTTNSQQFNGLAVNPGCSAIVLTSSGALNPLLLSLGSISRSPGGTVDFTLPGGMQSATNGITTSTPNFNGILGGFATVSGANWAASTGTAGYITAYSAYTGGNLGSGTLASNGALNVSPSGVQTALTSAGSFYTLNLTGTEGVTMSGTGGLLLAGGGLIGNTSGAISGGSLAGSSGTAAELIVFTPQNLTIGSVIVNNSGATALTKAGSATLVLTGNNTYSGLTTIGAGTLQIGSGGATGSLGSSPVIDDTALVFNLSSTTGFAGAISGSGTLTKTGTGAVVLGGSNSFSGGTTINQGTLQLANAAALLSTTVAINANNALQFSPGIGTYYLGGLSGGNLLKLADTAGGVIGLVVGGNGASTTFSGAISGSGSLTKTGGGTLVLSGSDTFGGGTLVNAGSLQIGSGTTGSLAGTIADNATLVFDRSDSPIFGGTISGSGLLVQAGTGILTLSASNGFSGGTTITAGSLSLNNANALPNSTLTVTNSNSLVFNTNFGAIATFNVGALAGSGNISLADGGHAVTLSAGGNGTSTTYSGALSGAGGLATTGSGVLDLCGSSTYTGLTTIAAGQLLLDFTQPGVPRANIINNASNASALTLAGGTLAIQGGPTLSNSQRFNGLTVNPGGSAIVLMASNPLLLSLGFITRSMAGGTIDVTLPGGTQSAANGITTTTPNNATGILGAYVTVGGADWACSTAGNITAYNAYATGDLGQMTSNAALNVELTGGTPQSNITSPVSFNTLNLTAGYGVTMTGLGSLVLAGGGLIGNTSGIISGGTLEGPAGTAGELIVVTPQNLAIASVIADNGGHTALTKTGSAALILVGSNTYSGATLVNGGTLFAGGANTLSPNSAVAVNNGVLDVTLGPQTVSSLSISSLGTLNLYAGNLLTSTGTASFAAGSTLSIYGQIAIPDILMTYSGSARGTFSNVSYNGGALPALDQLSYISGMLEIVTAPTLSTSGNWSTGNWSGGKAPNGPGQGAVLSTSNTAQLTVTLDVPVTLGALQFGSAGSPSAGWVLSGSSAAGLTFNDSGGTAAVTVLSGTNTITAQVSVAGGNLDIAASNGGILTLSSDVSDDGGQRSLTLDGDGSGRLILGGSNSYSGGTIVNAGLLVVNNVEALPDGSSLTVGAGAGASFDSPVAKKQGAGGASYSLLPAPCSELSLPGTVAVPEPGTLVLLAAGCLLAAIIRCRREGERSQRRV